MLNIGEIEYANVYPIFYELKKNSLYKFIKSYPSVLNKALRDGGIDISCCSSIEYARHPENYLILKNLSISSIKEVKSVCLFSNYEIKYLENKNIYLTDESGTSIVLLKVLLKKFLNINVSYSINKNDCDAFLYIGDKALYRFYNSEFKYVFDLGKLWYEFTGFPFVYALWLVNRGIIKEKKDILKDFYNKLVCIKANTKKNLSTLIDHYYFKGLTSYQIIDYWETINYDLTLNHLNGLKIFYKYAYEIGEIKKVPKLEFLTF
ncbi:menaquinone biosynthetic enzyme MqnA/MqnD family protein [Deferribacter abyssi]|uniref:menaquinone biosynthetic enzyme MqnA/MqnD family protein n=1 Tax=Deferribacter abyssi TaxID=213806 RepID=UPI003C234F1B